MKIIHQFQFGCLALSIGSLIIATPSYAQNIIGSKLIVQSETEDNSVVLEKKAEKLINLFFTQNFDSFEDVVVPELKVSVSPEKMEKSWQEITEENGNFSKIIQSQVINTPNSDLVIVTIEFEKNTQDWLFSFNKKQEVIGLNLPSSKYVEDMADEFMSSVIDGDYSNARGFFHPFLKETIFPERIESSWNNLLNKNGKFEQVIEIRLREGLSINQTNVVAVDLQFEKAEEEILIIFDSSKNIIGVDLIEQ